MWVFDGEQWHEEGGSEAQRPVVRRDQRDFEEFYPELQVVEVPRTPEPIPLLPHLYPQTH